MEIKEWIDNNGSYTEGVMILKRQNHPNYKIYQPFLDHQFSPLHIREKLKQDLKALADTIVEVKDNPKTIVEKPIDKPIEVIKLFKRQSELRTQRNAIHATLEDTVSQNERTDKAKAIIDMTHEIDLIFNQISDFEDKGILPIVKDDSFKSVKQTVELFKKLKYMPERISRLKSLIKDKATPTSKKERFKKELLLKKDELITLKEQANNLK